MNKNLDQTIPNEKKGQQLAMPIAQLGEKPQILLDKIIDVIDIRKDWPEILKTIYNNHHVQRAMEKAYQDFQEGHKLKDFKSHNGVNGAWAYVDIYNSRFPCILTTTNWLYTYEKKEWLAQAKDIEKEALAAIEEAIYICKKLTGYSEILDSLINSQNQLYLQYPPRANQPESWRPQNASFWTSLWIKILAETHYYNLTSDWRIIVSDSHSIVAGFTDDNRVYLFDMLLITKQPKKIIEKLAEN